jgi:uncharacterized membrane protein YeaQ/YmgE (transglycosylase-associated protein family)
MHIIGWIVFGLVIGLVAKLIMPGPNPHGFFATVILGILGAMLGGWIGQAMGLYAPGQPAGFFMALLGAVVLLLLYHFVFVRRTA